MTSAARTCAGHELRHRWRAHLALAATVAVVGGTALAVLAGAHRTSTALDRYVTYARATPDSFAIVGPGTDRVEQVAALPQVDQLTVLRQYALTGPDPGVFVPIGASLDGNFGTRFLRSRVIEGRRADPAAPEEVSVNETQARLLGVTVGDTLTLTAWAPDQIDDLQSGDGAPDPSGPVVRLEVTGITRNVGDVAAATDDPSVLVLTPAFDRRYHDRVGSFPGYLVAASLRRGDADIDAFDASVREIYEGGPAPQFQPVTGFTGLRSSLRVLSVGLALFGGAIAAAGLVALALATTRHIGGGAADDAVRRHLGMTRSARVASLALPLLTAGGAGAIAGVGVAVVASSQFPIGLGRRAEPSPGLRVDPAVLGVGALAIVLAVFLLAAVAGWRLTARTDAGRRIELVGERSRSLSAAARAGGMRPTATMGVQMATDPGRGRHAVPVRPAIVGAAVGAAGLVATLVFGASLDRLVASPERWGWGWDAAVTGSPAVRAALADHDGDVAAVARGTFVKLVIAGQAVDSVALDPRKGSIEPTVVAGRPPRAADEVVLGATTLSRRGLHIGDTVEAESPSGPQELRIVGRGVFPTLDDPVALADGAALTAAGIARLDDPTDSEGFHRLILRWAPGVDQQAADAWLSEAAGDAPTVARLPGEIQRLTQVDRLPEMLAGFLVALAVVAVAHAALSIPRRRQRELGVLAAIGFTPAQLRGVLCWQAATLAAIGLVLGVPAGVVIGRLAWSATASDLGVASDIAVPWGPLVVAGAATVLLLALAGLLAGQRVSRQHPAQALRAE